MLTILSVLDLKLLYSKMFGRICLSKIDSPKCQIGPRPNIDIIITTAIDAIIMSERLNHNWKMKNK